MPAAADTVVRLAGVSKTYPPIGLPGLLRRLGPHRTHAVDALLSLDLTLGAGERIALIGPNGAGKSTLMRILAGVIRASAGILEWPADDRLVRARVGWAARDDQSFSLRLSGRENLRFYAALDDHRGPHSDARIAAGLAEVALDDRADAPYRTYSSGMRQRLAIARALLREPRLLLLDEAASGLDPGARATLFETLRARSQHGVAMLFATHQLDEAQQLCDRFLVLDRGRLVADGPFSDVAEAATRAFARDAA